jgi:hypothetical protein
MIACAVFGKALLKPLHDHTADQNR